MERGSWVNVERLNYMLCDTICITMRVMRARIVIYILYCGLMCNFEAQVVGIAHGLTGALACGNVNPSNAKCLPQTEANMSEGALIIRVCGDAEHGYGAFVFEYKGDQCLVKHIIVAEGLSVVAASDLARKYKAEHPKFNWKAD